MNNEDIRDCKSCKNYVLLNIESMGKIQGCKKWKCEFEVKEEKANENRKNIL